jgi:penicillin-binding protein 1C
MAVITERGARWLRRSLRAGAVLVLASLVIRAALPDPLVDPTRFVHYPSAVAIVDRNGEPLRHARSGRADRRWVPLASISRDMIDAVIAIEDARFREHAGVDGRAMARALAVDLLPGGRWSGASTITQQLVKLVYGRPNGLADKPLEIARALALERIFDKDQILEQYLNRLPYGNGIVGVERASLAYFGHSASSLTLGEAALLAGIPQAPSATEPRRHLPRAMRRRARVLDRMATLGLRSADVIDAARTEEVRIASAPPRAWRAPRFVDRALRERDAGALVAREGRLVTSLDRPLQDRVEALLASRVTELSSRGVSNGAAIVVAISTGEVLAYVGAARSGPAAPGGELDLLEARRQPGSTLKPFVYQLFFEQGGTAASVLDDVASPMTGRRGAIYAPRDYDGLERGPVRARLALAGSLNLAALDAARIVGVERVLERLGALGLDDLPAASEVGPAVVLGGADVRPIDLAAAYVALARGGTRVALRSVPGAVAEGAPVMDPGAAAVTRDILADADTRASAFGSALREESEGLDIALKTGTSSGFRDAWAVAFDDRFTVLVWLGDPGSAPLDGVSGFEGAAPVAARIIAAAHQRLPSLGGAIASDVAPPIALHAARVCAHTGLVAGARCAHTVFERFVPGVMPSRTCDAHGEHGEVLLPHRYADWAARVRPSGIAVRSETLASTLASPVVAYPRDGARILADPRRGETRIPLRASVAGARAGDVSWEIDGAPWDDASWPVARGDHAFVAVWRGRRSAPARVRVE